jgi:hypothetical protein
MSKNNCVELRMFVWVSVLILLLTVIPVRAQLPTGTILGVVKVCWFSLKWRGDVFR